MTTTIKLESHVLGSPNGSLEHDTSIKEIKGENLQSPSTPTGSKRKSPRKKTPVKRARAKDSDNEEDDSKDNSLEVDIEDLGPPTNWLQMYETLRHQRATGPLAPVDTMGCDSHTHSDAHTARFHTVVSLMLSAQCKDTQNALTMAHLKRTLPGGLTLRDIRTIDEADLADLIRPCGMHNRKAQYLKRAAELLHTEFKDDVPRTIEGLLRLPGVGPKMGYLILSSAWGIVDGIGVDTHVHRICNLLGWVKTTAPEQTRVALQAWLPRALWKEINHLMVGHGQTVCLPRGRRCDECALAGMGCPSVVAPSPARKRRVKLEAVKYEDEDEKTATDLRQDDAGIPAKMEIIEGVTEDQIDRDLRDIATEVSPYFAKQIEQDLAMVEDGRVKKMEQE